MPGSLTQEEGTELLQKLIAQAKQTGLDTTNVVWALLAAAAAQASAIGMPKEAMISFAERMFDSVDKTRAFNPPVAQA